MQHEAVNELFGLAGSFPRPGWVVLDAARDHRFTGELHFDISPPVRVYFDRGHIYLAERTTDPSLGARLVDAGALSAVQLERGSVRVGDIEHLGRLFERIPNLDRHTVIVTAELMTEECVGWLAAQRVPEVGWTPYRHHESGVHLWARGRGGLDLAPGDPLPAPTPDDVPVASAPPPASTFVAVGEHTDTFPDGLIEWDEPSWLDSSQLERELVDPFAEQHRATDAAPHPEIVAGPDPTGTPDPAATAGPAAGGVAAPDAAGAETDAGTEDWVGRLPIDGLPDSDPLASPKPLPRMPVAPTDRFELVWPSGEIDEEFGSIESVVGSGHDPDADRIGASARLARPAGEGPPDVLPTRVQPIGSDAASEATSDVSETGADEPLSDEVVLAVRRAVASIEVGSLAARQRLVDASDHYGAASRGAPDYDDSGVPAPGRVAVRSGRNDWSRRTVTRSVFDEPAIEPAVVEPEPMPEPRDHRERRAGALRRLIGSLRR